MYPYFLRAGESQQSRGDVTCLDRVQKVFAQDEQGGIIDVKLSPTDRLVYLYQSGQQIAVYRVTPALASLGNARDAAALIHPETSIRYLKLPDQATRAVWQALAWYPPARSTSIDGRILNAYLDTLRTAKVNGQLQLVLPDMDGFLLLQDGELVSNGIILASEHGFLETLPGLQGRCEIWFSEMRFGTPVTDITHLRIAYLDWISHWLEDYQRLVGSNLIAHTNTMVNAWLRQHRYNMRLVGGSLVDHHLFVEFGLAVEAYQGLTRYLCENLSQVIGTQLVIRTAVKALSRLKDHQQRALTQQGIMKMCL